MHFTVNASEEEEDERRERTEVVEGPETRFRILCVREEDAAGLPDEVRSTVRVHEVRLAAHQTAYKIIQLPE